MSCEEKECKKDCIYWDKEEKQCTRIQEGLKIRMRLLNKLFQRILSKREFKMKTEERIKKLLEGFGKKLKSKEERIKFMAISRLDWIRHMVLNMEDLTCGDGIRWNDSIKGILDYLEM